LSQEKRTHLQVLETTPNEWDFLLNSAVLFLADIKHSILHGQIVFLPREAEFDLRLSLFVLKE
jgi:hypothetical protein